MVWYASGALLLPILILIFILLRRSSSSAQYSPFTPHHSFPHTTRFTCRIGVIAPLLNDSLKELCSGMTEALDKSDLTIYTVRTYHGDNDRVLLFTQIKQALKENDLLVTHGKTATLLAYEAVREQQRSTPIFFSGIRYSQLSALRNNAHGSPVVGIVSKRNHIILVNKLRAIKKNLRSVLIIFREQQPWIQNEIQEITRYFQAHGIRAFSHLLAHDSHIDHQLSSLKYTFDTIMLMPRTVNAQGMQGLINYCNGRHITLCSDTLDGVLLGASIGFGGETDIIGNHIAKLVRDLVEFNKKPAEDFLTDHIEQYRVAINRTTMKQQDLVLSNTFLFLLEQAEVDTADGIQQTKVKEAV